MRDADIRRVLRCSVLDSFRREPETRVVEELGILEGDSRIDVAVVNGLLHGFEIKSERDTLNRLPQQVTAYNRVFDKLTVVVSAKHLASSQKLVSPWWGILSLKTAGADVPPQLTEVRPATVNAAVEAFALAQLLWRDEALSILKGMGLTKGLLTKPRPVLWQALCDAMPLSDLSRVVRTHLKVRPAWRSDVTPS